MPDKIPFGDISHLPEDDRISIIGKYATDHKKIVGVALENEKGKIDRYCEKLLSRFPELTIIAKVPLTRDTVLVKVGPKT
jgi:hypothetical protein